MNYEFAMRRSGTKAKRIPLLIILSWPSYGRPKVNRMAKNGIESTHTCVAVIPTCSPNIQPRGSGKPTLNGDDVVAEVDFNENVIFFLCKPRLFMRLPVTHRRFRLMEGRGISSMLAGRLAVCHGWPGQGGLLCPPRTFNL